MIRVTIVIAVDVTGFCGCKIRNRPYLIIPSCFYRVRVIVYFLACLYRWTYDIKWWTTRKYDYVRETWCSLYDVCTTVQYEYGIWSTTCACWSSRYVCSISPPCAEIANVQLRLTLPNFVWRFHEGVCT